MRTIWVMEASEAFWRYERIAGCWSARREKTLMPGEDMSDALEAVRSSADLLKKQQEALTGEEALSRSGRVAPDPGKVDEVTKGLLEILSKLTEFGTPERALVAYAEAPVRILLVILASVKQWQQIDDSIQKLNASVQVLVQQGQAILNVARSIPKGPFEDIGGGGFIVYIFTRDPKLAGLITDRKNAYRRLVSTAYDYVSALVTAARVASADLSRTWSDLTAQVNQLAPKNSVQVVLKDEVYKHDLQFTYLDIEGKLKPLLSRAAESQTYLAGLLAEAG